ncbi:FAD-dependent oxidoreductase [Desulforhopalus singaporensis]|uniref:Heterodisulfide reductase subunit A n=1 Tax=Desulforhopalus singaporensis TaxID=91360 RepID=A0A1H0MUU8_9BACT|nr:FAD-dependent oxidoreductase [Desulforhopalus singaporensis]SDO84161.1 heterodisulfide reductase subunit A [Desulforhopalus singaporensis]
MQNSNKTQTPNNKILVVGGGLGGIRTALDLAEAEKDVVLVDNDFTIGGLMTQLDRTFPTNNCDLCTISPHLSESNRQEHIELMSMTSVENISGEKGNFTASLRTAPRYINLDKCTGCGECYSAFPECVRFTPGLDHRAPTCMRYPQATPQAFSIDLKKCEDVQALVKVCPAGAINPDDMPINREVKCASVVLSPGASLFDPSHLDYLGYANLPDVVTSLEFERILSASGPTGGKLVRPSNGEQPKKVAWIQCIGSRGLQKGAGSYCSNACCMFALKEAIVTKERFQEDIETTIFYMDMRTFGKDYELYLNRAKNEYGVRFIRSRPHSVLQPEGETDLLLNYTLEDTTEPLQEKFDMVVLSTGFKTSEATRELASKLGLELNDNFFPVTDGFNPVVTSKKGVYVAGTFESPKDIPETMVQASAAAFMAASELGPATETVVAEDEDEAAEELLERDVSLEEPKVGVFICDCGENIGGLVDVNTLVEHAAKLPYVAVAKAEGHGCSRISMENIRQTIEEEQLNRVVIGGCSPRTHQAKFEDLLQKAKLNKYLLEIANIRDQATWVHPNNPEKATEKAKDLIQMSVGAVVKAQPLAEQSLPMNKNVLVVGGGVTGMTAALNLADQGFQIYLAEKSDKLGGMANNLLKTLEGNDVQAFVGDMVDRVKNHEKIQVFTRAIIVDHSGMPGMFTTGMQSGKQMFYRQIEHGITILATGALSNRPKQYLLDESSVVRTQLETQRFIADNPDQVKQWENVVMIQCVGSRTQENPNCSRICCQNAVKNALAILDVNPEARVFVLYRDMRTYGFQENYYRLAREKGVIFVRYTTDRPPVVEAEGDKVNVTYYDSILSMNVSVTADNLSLSTGLIADTDSTEELSMIFKLPRTADGYFLEDHVKLRPVDMPVPGFFVAGTAHSPKLIRESITQANAVSARAHTMLARDEINLGAGIAKVDGTRCAACLVCVRACPFDIPFINAEGYSEIDPAKCHGCGVCASECPAKAIQLMQFEDDRILAKVEQLFERVIA